MKKNWWIQISTLFIVSLSYLFLYIPLCILVIFSFNSKIFPAPWQNFTFSWYYQLFTAKELWASFLNSLIISTTSTFLSLFMGVFLIFFKTHGGKMRKTMPLFYGNLIIPETMIAISLMSYFSFFNIELGMSTLIVSHIVLGLGFVIPILYIRYLQLDPTFNEASYSLGATPFQTFFRITIPLLKPTLIAVGFLIFILSFDDFIFSIFCAGTSIQTLSLYILSMLRSGVSPILNALSAILLLFSTIFVTFFFSSKTRTRIL